MTLCNSAMADSSSFAHHAHIANPVARVYAATHEPVTRVYAATVVHAFLAVATVRLTIITLLLCNTINFIVQSTDIPVPPGSRLVLLWCALWSLLVGSLFLSRYTLPLLVIFLCSLLPIAVGLCLCLDSTSYLY